MDERILVLEERLAYQSRTIEALDGVVLEFTRKVELLERKMEEMQRQVDEARDAIEPHDTKPPHY